MHTKKSSDVVTFVVRCLSELPSDQVIYKTGSHSYTGGQLIKEVKEQSEIGVLYCSEVFRVARDLIVRKKAK